MPETPPERVCPSGLCLPVRSDSVSRKIPPGGHEFPLIGPEKAPNFDVFGHNPQRTLSHENLGRHFDSGAAHDFRRGLYGSGHDERSADSGKCELRPRFEAWVLGDDWNAFGRSSSETDMPARRGGRISGRIAGLRGGDTPSRAGPNRQPAITGSLALWREGSARSFSSFGKPRASPEFRFCRARPTPAVDADVWFTSPRMRGEVEAEGFG